MRTWTASFRFPAKWSLARLQFNVWSELFGFVVLGIYFYFFIPKCVTNNTIPPLNFKIIFIVYFVNQNNSGIKVI